MKIGQALKMALKSILGNKGRSMLTMLGIIIGIASVMTIVSVINGSNKKSMEMMAAMGTNKITVYANYYNGQDVFRDLYDYCQKLTDYVDGVTPNSQFSATVVYGTKNSSKMGGNGGYSYMGGGMAMVDARTPKCRRICISAATSTPPATTSRSSGGGIFRCWTSRTISRSACWARGRRRRSSTMPTRWGRRSR